MKWHEVTCVTMASSTGDPLAGVTHIGGPSSRGRGWRMSVQEAIQGMLTGELGFFLERDNQRANLVVGYSKEGYRYLKVEGDENGSKVLLDLPECGM
jgi:hypothetical protein